MENKPQEIEAVIGCMDKLSQAKSVEAVQRRAKWGRWYQTKNQTQEKG